jgi:hypothetical protein
MTIIIYEAKRNAVSAAFRPARHPCAFATHEKIPNKFYFRIDFPGNRSFGGPQFKVLSRGKRHGVRWLGL